MGPRPAGAAAGSNMLGEGLGEGVHGPSSAHDLAPCCGPDDFGLGYSPRQSSQDSVHKENYIVLLPIKSGSS